METSTTLLPSTRSRYAYEVGLFARIMEVTTLEEITPGLLLQWNTMLHDAGGATGTVGQKHSALVKFFSFLEDFEESEHAGQLLRAMRRLSPPRATRPRRQTYALEEEQVRRIIAAAAARPGVGVRDRAIVHFIWATGVRRGELVTAKLDDLDLERRVATVTGKGSKPRVVVFDSETQEVLANWIRVRANSEPKVPNLFISVDGTALNVHTIGAIIKAAAKRARIRKDVWPHLFRHTRITDLLDGGMSLQDTAAFAGHNNVNTTLRYFHEQPDQLRQRYDRATGRKEPAAMPADTTGAGGES
jgi:site-specific recombinase XerD